MSNSRKAKDLLHKLKKSWSSNKLMLQTFGRIEQKMSLIKRLEDSRHHWPIPQTDAGTFFIPRNCIESLLTFEAVMDQLCLAYRGKSKAWIKSLAQDVCRSAKKLFIILMCGGYLDSSDFIDQFIDEEITDNDLPFTKRFLDNEDPQSSGNGRYVVCKKGHYACRLKDHSGCGIKVLDRAGRRLGFICQSQWIVLAPVFGHVPNNTHLEFSINTIMPFVNDYEQFPTQTKHGGYAEVWKIVIHAAHQEFDQIPHIYAKEAQFAIKRQFTADASEFQAEKLMLTTLKNHKHLIKLLTAYKFKNKYHFMFQWADSNLADYWNSRFPDWTAEGYLWVLDQMIGLTSGLATIHSYTSHTLKNQQSKVQANLGHRTLQNGNFDTHFHVHGDEAKWGRHGDLKGENILWFDGPNGGTLQISDLGLGRFHGLESRSKVNPNTLNGSPTYSPPEVMLNKLVSRKYDIWSLGCVFSEFVTWVIEGPKGIQNFADARMLSTDPSWEDDRFFALVNNIQSGAVLRPKVSDWFEHLRSNKRCSPMLHDLLTLIQERMLSINSSNRLSSDELLVRLKKIRTQANDKAYVI